MAEGRLDGFAIECPRHGAKFDIRNGRALTMPATRPTVAHEVKVEGDQVFIRLNENP
ncbi:MAG: Rieske 2Fe-2S domain-containing protein [Thermoguttaceae bacterium]